MVNCFLMFRIDIFFVFRENNECKMLDVVLFK